MPRQELPPWLNKNTIIDNKKKKAFLQRYQSELELESENRIFPGIENQQIFQALTGGKNWHLWMPTDSVTRIKKSRSRYAEFKSIVSETASAIPIEDELEPRTYYALADNIITRLSGSTDFSHRQARSDEFDPDPNGGNSTCTDMPIVVQSINQRNLEDWYIYVIPNAPELFENSIHSMTHAAHTIIQNEIEPIKIVRDVGFYLHNYTRGRNSSIPGVTAPKESVTIVENYDGMTEDPLYCQIDSPREIFGNEWGDVDQMRSILSGDQFNSFCDNTIGYYVSAGVSE